MAPYGIEITMSLAWKGIEEEFSNLFHFDTGAPITTDSGWQALVDAIVAELKPIHGTSVKFKRARVFGPTNGDKIDNVMQYVADLTGNGTASSGGIMNPETAVVVSCYLGRGPKGGKRILRKYFHSRTLVGEITGGAAERAEAVLNSTCKAAYALRMNNLKNVTIGASTNSICAPNGDHLPLNSTFVTSDYVTTRQFRRRSKRRPETA